MQTITVTKFEEGQKLFKLLQKYLSAANTSFLYKMLRKKNITLNGKRADGKELLVCGDAITFFLSDETIIKFGGSFDTINTIKEDIRKDTAAENSINPEKNKKYPFDILYEDDDLLFVSKPAGILTQKADANDISLNESIIEYLMDSGAVPRQKLAAFRPGVCNRLDRNTSGIVAAGKTVSGLQFLSEAFRERTIKKYYYCIVQGMLYNKAYLDGFLKKDSSTNKVFVLPLKDSEKAVKLGCVRIQTAYRPVLAANGFTLLEVELITGKTHQIRAHLSFQGNPILGDVKYGGKQEVQESKLNYQLLHAGKLCFGKIEGRFSYITGKTIEAELPELFRETWRKITGQDVGSL